MDSIDRTLLTIINKGIPIEEQPFEVIAGSVGISEAEVIQRVRSLKDSGIIRRIGAVVNPRGIGWTSTLCAADVPLETIDAFLAFVNNYAEVTHNYLREGKPNCWFTLIAPGNERLSEIIGEIENAFGLRILNLPASRVFKINVALDMH